ncbi:MAG: FGGY-family carbohydrate kinase [Symploca sp. SIO2D2]|nr:FGGY-family carbohydrate kinase [Symploca sp. SIO2D2]
MNFSLGIDFGTSGARAMVIDPQRTIQAQAQYPWEPSSTKDLAASWQQALFGLIEQIPQEIRRGIKAIAIDGTSSTVLLCDRWGKPVAEPLLYHDARGLIVREKLAAIAPNNQVVLSATSSLAKLLWWESQQTTAKDYYFLHQADWLAFLLHGKLGISDYHNALKLGYDPQQLCYTSWMEQLRVKPILPEVLAPGTPVSEVSPEIACSLGLQRHCLVCAGTTDSIAAFLASGAQQPGEAVTSLGSTLVLKLLSRHRVDDARYGIYSHRLGDGWLTGGASNTGGAVLRHFFSDTELADLSSQIDPNQESSLDYYPLLGVGDRFPVNDPYLQPKLEPRPPEAVAFLQGLLEGMARIEARGYHLLQQLGATPLSQVYTAGGGAKNPAWTAIRKRYLHIPILPPKHAKAAYGTAILALEKGKFRI